MPRDTLSPGGVRCPCPRGSIPRPSAAPEGLTAGCCARPGRSVPATVARTPGSRACRRAIATVLRRCCCFHTLCWWKVMLSRHDVRLVRRPVGHRAVVGDQAVVPAPGGRRAVRDVRRVELERVVVHPEVLGLPPAVVEVRLLGDEVGVAAVLGGRDARVHQGGEARAGVGRVSRRSGPAFSQARMPGPVVHEPVAARSRN